MIPLDVVSSGLDVVSNGWSIVIFSEGLKIKKLKFKIKIKKNLILGFHVAEKTKIILRLNILSFYLYRVKDIFKRISAGLSSAR